jgi:serine/threonine protein kinase
MIEIFAHGDLLIERDNRMTLAGRAGQHQQGLPSPGTRIGSYELIRELGRGGMGAVYMARDVKLGRRVAIKFLHTEQPETTRRFIVEGRATARCSHENIVVIHDVGEHLGHPFMVLEYLQGKPLGKLLDRPLPPQRVLELIVPVVRALACAHEQGIIHRDLKPDNIFVTDAGTVKVLDFGIAKLGQDTFPDDLPSEPPADIPGERAGDLAGAANTGDTEQAGLTRRGAIMGTLAYMSPEQWGVDEVDARSDLWAVGIILYRMVAGKHPLAPLQGRELMVTGILSEPMPSVRSACPDLPDELAAVIDRCLRKPKAERIGSARELLAALEPLLLGRQTRSLQTYDNPYPGLGAFQEADAGRFFGRGREIAAALARLREQPLLGVVGPSGVGKSSFVRAGVLPAVKQSGEPWTGIVVRPGRHPLGSLAQALAPFLHGDATETTRAGTSPGDVTPEQLAERLRAEPGYLGSALRSRARRRNQRVLLVIDQLEELYTLVANASERLAFTACLASAADDPSAPVRVVVTIRSDFIDRVAEDSYFMAELARSLFFLAPPGRDSLRDALVEPAEQAGYQFESPAMVQHMLDHLTETHGALPLLQFAASKLWERRDRGRRLLTEDSYREIGGITGALASHADSVIAELAPAGQALARTVLVALVTPERTRAVVPLRELGELGGGPRATADVEYLVTHLAQARLLVIQTGGVAEGDASAGAPGAAVEIVHESLIHTWPRLRRWLDENQDDAAFLAELRNAARQWQARGRPSGLLWRGEAMEEARRWHRRYHGELPEAQRDYLAAVFHLADRSRRMRRVLLGGAFGFMTLLVAAAAVALLVIRDAERKAAEKAIEAQNAANVAQERLEQVEQKERERARAAEEAQASERKAQANAQALARSNAELAEQADALARSLEAATKARRKEREAKNLALENEAQARQAEEEAHLIIQRLQQKLEDMSDRIRELEELLETLIDDVQVQPAAMGGAR